MNSSKILYLQNKSKKIQRNGEKTWSEIDALQLQYTTIRLVLRPLPFSAAWPVPFCATRVVGW